MPETAYLHPTPAGHFIEHGYGNNVHIMSDPWALSVLARIGHPDCKPPVLHDLISSAYWRLLHSTVDRLPTKRVDTETRMTEAEGIPFHGRIIDPLHRAVVVDVARAGILPAQVCQRSLLEFLDADSVRVDHFYLQRIADPVSGELLGVDMSGSKIGGPVEGATVYVPDPMGASGSTVRRVIRYYHENVEGRERQIIACHLMVTPEYLQRITTEFPDVLVYALRVDRGLSAPDVLETPLGARWDEERGLNDHAYIVPGAGGMGEVINNSFV